MTDVVARALPLWGLDAAQANLIAARENAVYRVDHAGRSFALRLHRLGYRTDAELWSELQWMAACAEAGLTVPAPIASQSSAMMHVVDGVQVDVLTWLPGRPLQDCITTLEPAARQALFQQLGGKLAQLHNLSDAWQRPPGFTRCAWNANGLVGDDPLWDRFWDNPALTPTDQALFVNIRDCAQTDLSDQSGALDYGLIHADLVPGNVMVDGNSLSLIDFDDGGFGFRLFDVVTALHKFQSDDDFDTLRAALIQGYTTRRPLDTTALPLFFALRALTYVGWNIKRMGEPGGAQRNARFIATARDVGQAYLDTR